MAWNHRTFVISLPRSEQRRKDIDRSLHEAGIAYKLWTGFDGSIVTPKDMTHTVGWLCRNRLTCTSGVIGCYVSHVSLWHYIASNTTPGEWCLVLEDDAMYTCRGHSLRTFIHKAVNSLPPSADLLNLSDPACHVSLGEFIGNVAVEPAHFMVTTCAYVVSKEGAIKLLQTMDHAVHYHVDFMISAHVIMNQLMVYRSRPSVFIQNEHNKSTVSHRTFPTLPPRLFGSALRPALASAILGISGFYLNVAILFYGIIIATLPNTTARVLALLLIIAIEGLAIII